MARTRDPESGQVQEQVAPGDVLSYFEQHDLPFVTSKMVATEFNCSGQTARNKLGVLVERGDLDRVDLGGRRAVWTHPDYADIKQIAQALREYFDLEDVETERVENFADEPYVLLPKSGDEVWAAVPRWVPFELGWLDRQTKSYNVFIINKYTQWIYDLPEDISERMPLEKRYEDVVVHDNLAEFVDEEDRDDAWDHLGGQDGGLHRREEDTKIRIQRGHEFEVIAKLVDEGNLPFTPRPVDEEDLRDPPESIELDAHVEGDYQHRAWERFLDTGMIGIFWPFSAGKSYFGVYAGDRISGSKLVIVPNNTLKEQWQEDIKEHARRTWEWDVETYQYFNHDGNLQTYQEKDLALTIYEEAHHLPANVFSRVATIGTKYRIGLSGSPYREDGREEYIFALTGFPVGMNWQELVELGVVKMPPVKVYLYSTVKQKAADVLDLIDGRPGKILVFCDSIDRGQAIADELAVPFIYGETTNRMEKYRNNRIVVTSRVGDEGLSLKDLDVVIEHDFLGASRRQQAQRVGRVMHGESDGEYVIQMTDEEIDKHGERLYALEERGFELKFQRRE